MEPQNAAMVGQKLFKIMTAVLESYSSNDNDHSRVDYMKISQSEELRRYSFDLRVFKRILVLNFRLRNMYIETEFSLDRI